MTDNPQAEAAVLGAIILRNDCLDDCDLKPTDFATPSNQEIFNKMQLLHADGQPVDLVTLSEGHSKPSYLSSLVDNVPATRNFKAYEEQVRESAQRRAVLAVCKQYENEATGNPSVTDVMAGFEEGALAISQGTFGKGFEVLATGTAAHSKKFDEIQSGATQQGLKTGFEFIDRLTGGLQAGELCIIAARPGQGKTTLAMNIANNVAARREAAGFLSLEMSEWALRVRMVCSVASIDSAKVRAGTLDDDEKASYKLALMGMGSQPMYINDNSRTTLRTFKSQARRLVRKEGCKLLVIDYLQLMETGDRDESRRHAIDKISRNLKTLAQDLEVPIIVLSQLNRGNEKDKRKPRISDLKESGAIEQDADIVILLHCDPDEDGIKYDCMMEKNRGGATGCGELHFEKQFNRFESR